MKRRRSIFHLGPFCIKQYGAHKHVVDVPPIMRLERELQGSKLLKAPGVQVARPWWVNRGQPLLVRRWYCGTHPEPPVGLTTPECDALAAWLRGHGGRGTGLRIVGGNHLPIEIRCGRLPVNRQIVDWIERGNDLLHGDLVAANLLRTRHGLVVLDAEAISVGHLAWDAAHVVAFVLGLEHPLVSCFLALLGLTQTDRSSTWSLACALLNRPICA